MTERPTIILKGWQVAVAAGLLILWFVGDYVLLSMLDASALDCLASDTRSSRKVEAFVCSPQLLGEGALGWITFLWMWGPLAALVIWSVTRKRPAGSAQ